jgi:plasmid stabilization system protein ParE
VSRFRVEILPEAEAEIREAFVWYFERSALAADAFRTEVLDCVDELAERADMWPTDEDDIRFRVLVKFPYTVHYDLSGDIATVLAVAHQRRLPGYWKRR